MCSAHKKISMVIYGHSYIGQFYGCFDYYIWLKSTQIPTYDGSISSNELHGDIKKERVNF